MEEIEVTEEMIMAGWLVWDGFDPERQPPTEMIKQVYLAICSAREKGRKDSRPAVRS